MKDDVLKKIQGTATAVYESIKAGKSPALRTPVRSLSNVEYDPEAGYFALAGNEKTRALTATTIKVFTQTLLLMNESKQVIADDDIMTKREAYYVSKNWGDAKFDEQPESDTVMDDVEAMLGVLREQLGFIPEEKGGDIAGKLIVYDKDPDTGKEIRIDCSNMGSGSYSTPSNVEGLRFESDAKFVLAIETAGMFQRLVKHKFWQTQDCILISMGGVPSRACRRIIRRLSDDLKIPVHVFTDGDPYGYFNIYRTLKVGSGNSAHINENFCVPDAHFLGVTPQDIVDYKLPTHKLKDVDIKRAKDAVKNDPFVQHHKEWQEAIKLLLKRGERAEQQALAKHGLNFVITDYLPAKLKERGTWLP